jgi:hypothetical protein
VLLATSTQLLANVTFLDLGQIVSSWKFESRDWIQLAIACVLVFTAILYLLTFVNVAQANRRLAVSLRLTNLAQMIGEMNDLRQFRAEHPDLERALFEQRRDWSSIIIQRNLTAVQLANILEWAYIARRNNLIEKDVWESWARTWRDVILASTPLQESFSESVWTFGRADSVLSDLQQIISRTDAIPDPRQRRRGRGTNGPKDR